MDLSVLRFMREYDKGVEESMNDARDYLPINHNFSFEEEKALQRCINDYNKLSRFYRNQGLNIESIEIICNVPYQTPEILRDRLMIKRVFRKIERTNCRRKGLSEREIKREIERRGLGII